MPLTIRKSRFSKSCDIDSLIKEQWIVQQTSNANCFMAYFAGTILAYNLIVDGLIRFGSQSEINVQCCETKLISSCFRWGFEDKIWFGNRGISWICCQEGSLFALTECLSSTILK